LYAPGQLTCGFDVWIESCRVSANKRELRSRLQGSGSSAQFSVLACMERGPQYQVRWKGAPVDFTAVHDGLLQIQLPNGGGTGELEISALLAR
jgi:hypothetical protein